MRPITEIIVHCAATQPTWWEGKTAEQKRDEIRRWHVQDNGWGDIGYHWIIDRDGSRAPGRDEATIGAHCKGHNAQTIGICLMGGHGSNEDDEFSANFTREQDSALRRLISEIKERHPTIKKVTGHNEYAAKACPGFRVARWLAHKPAHKAKTETLIETVTSREGLAVVAAPALGAAASVADGSGPVQYAIAAVLVIGAIAGAFYVLRRRA